MPVPALMKSNTDAVFCYLLFVAAAMCSAAFEATATAVPVTDHQWMSLAHESISLKDHPLAVCNDGSPGSYYAKRNVNNIGGSNKTGTHWLVAFEAGGFCMNDVGCAQRTTEMGMASSTADIDVQQVSSHITQIALAMEAGTDVSVSVIFIRYCSSDFFIGNNSRLIHVEEDTTAVFHFRGHEIVQAVLTTELQHDAHQAPLSSVTMYGMSAGCAGALAHVETVQSLAPGAYINLVLDSPPPLPFVISDYNDIATDLKKLAEESHLPASAVKSNGRFLDVYSASIEWYDPPSKLARTAMQNVGMTVQAACYTDVSCFLEFLERQSQTPPPRIMLIAPQQDAYTLTKGGGLGYALLGANNTDAPELINVQLRLQRVFEGSSTQNAKLVTNLSVPPTIWSPACPLHVMALGAWYPPLAGFGLAGGSISNQTHPDFGIQGSVVVGISQGDTQADVLLSYNFTPGKDQNLFTNLLVDKTSLATALAEWAAAIRYDNTTMWGGYGTSRVDTCSGYSCNPTCPFELEMSLSNDSPTEKLSRLAAAFVALMLCIMFLALALALIGRRRDRLLHCASQSESDEDTGDNETSGKPSERRRSLYSIEDHEESGFLRLVHLSVTAGDPKSKPAPKQILKDVSLTLKPGLTALMGPSGSGKTTMLNAMAGRLKGDTLTMRGKIYFGSGIDIADDEGFGYAMSHSGYVMQLATPWDDSLTSRENITYAAEMRLCDEEMADRELKDRVESILEDLDMAGFADTVVGGIGGRAGLSGGQKRKLAVAMQIIDASQFLFLDEPSSGLDASSTLALLRLLRRMADKNQQTIVVTIHQPRVEVWNLFNEVAVLADGQLCYQGRPNDAVDYLSALFHDDAVIAKCLAETTNPADGLLDALHDKAHQIFAGTAYLHQNTTRKKFKALSKWTLNRLKNPTPVPPPPKHQSAYKRDFKLAFIEYRRLVKATAHLPVLAVKTSLFIGISTGIFFFNALNPALYLCGLTFMIAGTWVINNNEFAVAISQHFQLVKCDIEDGVLTHRHFLMPAAAYLFATSCIAGWISCGIAAPLIGNELLDAQTLINIVAAHHINMAVGLCLLLFAVILPGFLPVDVAGVVVTLSFTFTTASGLLFTMDQLRQTIGGWLLHVSYTFHAMSLASKIMLYGRTFDSCNYNSDFFNCGPGSAMSGEAVLLVVGYHDTSSILSIGVVFGWMGLLVLGTAVVAYRQGGQKLGMRSPAITPGSTIWLQLENPGATSDAITASGTIKKGASSVFARNVARALTLDMHHQLPEAGPELEAEITAIEELDEETTAIEDLLAGWLDTNELDKEISAIDDSSEGTSTLFPPLPVRINTVGPAIIRTAETNTIAAEARLKEDAAKATALAHAKRDQRMTQAGMDAVTQALEFGPVGGAEPAALPIAKHGSSRVHPVG